VKITHLASLDTGMRKAAIARGSIFAEILGEDNGSLGFLPLLREEEAACLQGIRQLSLEAGEEDMSNDNSHNMQSDLCKVELRLPDLLDLEEHFTSAAVSLVLREDGINMHFLKGDL